MENQTATDTTDFEYKDYSAIKIRSKKHDGYITFPKRPMIIAHFPMDSAVKFLELGEELDFQPDEAIISQHVIGRDFFLICAGVVAVWREGTRLARLGQGDVFGELVIFRDHYRIASVRAETAVRLLKFNRHVLMDFFARSEPRIFNIYTINVIEILRRKLVLTNRRVCELEQKLLNR